MRCAPAIDELEGTKRLSNIAPSSHVMDRFQGVTNSQPQLAKKVELSSKTLHSAHEKVRRSKSLMRNEGSGREINVFDEANQSLREVFDVCGDYLSRLTLAELTSQRTDVQTYHPTDPAGLTGLQSDPEFFPSTKWQPLRLANRSADDKNLQVNKILIC